MAELKKLYLNRGHSDNDPGAVGYEVERELNVKVCNYVEQHLKANYQVSIKSSRGSVDSLTTICNEANTWGADFFLSVHFNAGGGDGHEILAYSSANYAVAKVFDDALKAIGQNSRGVKYRPDLGVLRLTDMKAVLIECAFVDNWADIKEWNDDAELKKMGEAIAEAAAEVMELPKKAKTKKYVTLESLNFRKKPVIDNSKCKTIPKGTVVEVESVDENGWGKTEYKGEFGYIRIKSRTKSYCRRVTAYKTLSEMNFRAKASAESKSFGTIPKGKTVYVYNVDENGWGSLIYDGKDGFVRIKSSIKPYCKQL